MRKQPEVTAQTKANLIQAFWELYRQKKIERITVKELTAKAGYNRSTFYEYFGDMYDVLNQLEEALLEYMKEQVLQGLEGGSNDDFIQKLANVFEAKGDYLGTLLSEDGDPNFARKLKTIMRPAMTTKYGLPEIDPYTAYIFEFGMSAIIGTITHWYNNKQDLSSKELVRLIRAMLQTGIEPEVRKSSNRTSSILGSVGSSWTSSASGAGDGEYGEARGLLDQVTDL